MNLSKIILGLLLCVLFSHTLLADWVKQDSGTLAWLQSIYFVDDKYGWIVGSNGTLLSTNDGGHGQRRKQEPEIRFAMSISRTFKMVCCYANAVFTGPPAFRRPI